MTTNRLSDAQLDLDPDDWDVFRELANGALDRVIAYLRTIRNTMVWQAAPEEMFAAGLNANWATAITSASMSKIG
jgi:hypothetical protein